ncbi:hypothetical protein MB14_09250 [Roseivirga ehrenbergii]|uniref:Cadherin domain-containing protein n=1 Tax=Roseivirga ehrenbergii (strain DSM 102268 / JCM 13514 / KCTC 12282 / NCIMB 14502 / KMM 6017) TaxID=279360 RepID=A0A150X0K4_ROSEK|nr:hypothetical protein MB14_09250 [Roseivirga ehrenbergii]
MRQSVLLFIFLLFTQSIFAQKLDWVTELKTPDDSYSGINLSIADGSGGVYFLTGAAYPTTLVSPSASVNLAFDEVNSNGANIVRLDASGEMVFQVNIGVERSENNGYFSTQGLTVDDDGNVYIGGYVASSTTISVGDVNIPITQNLNERKYGLILKFSDSGSLLDYKVFNVNKDYYHRFFSMDFYDGNLYVLYALIDSAIEVNGGGDEYLFTHHITVYDLSWNTIKSKTFSGKSRNTGSSGDPRRQFMMSGIKVFDNEQVYLSGVIQNGQGSDLDEDIVTDNPAMVSSVIKLDENLNFEWFRGIQGYNTSPYATGMVILSNGDVVLNSMMYSYNGFPTNLVGNNIEDMLLPNQLQYSTRQVFFTSDGVYKYQTLFEGVIEDYGFEADVNDNINIPIGSNNLRSLNFIDQDGSNELIVKKESGASTNSFGYLKISKEGKYQSHRFYAQSSNLFIDQMKVHLGMACESFLFLGRYGNENAIIDLDFDENLESEIQNLNSSYDYFIASYSNQKAELTVDQQSITQDGNQIAIPISFSDESISDLVFEVTSSNESVVNTGNVVLNLSAEQPNIVVHRAEGANGSADVQIKLIDSCGEETSATVTINLNEINNIPIFESVPVTVVDQNNYYEYLVEVSDPDGDRVSLSVDGKPSWMTVSTQTSYVVSTLAGSGSNSTIDGTGQDASFSSITRLSIDGNGNLYLGELGSKTIRKVSPEGSVATLSLVSDGTRIDGTLSESSFGEPNKILIDYSSGIKYVLDGSIIRKIDTEGNVSDFVGSGFFGNVDGQGTEARFTTLMGGAIDTQGNLYVADFGNHSIRKVTPAGLVTTLAGSGTEGYADGTGIAATFNRPFDIAINSNDIVFVADEGNDRIRRIEPNGEVTTFAGSGVEGFLDGNGQNAMFFEPKAVDFDSQDNLFVADWGNNRVRKITSSGDVTTIAGNGQWDYSDGNALEAGIWGPIGLTIDSNDNIYVSTSLNRIRKIKLEEDYLLSGTANPSDGIVDIILQAEDTKSGVKKQAFSIKLDITSPVFNSPANYQLNENISINSHAYAGGANDETQVTFSLGNAHDESLFNMNGQYTNAVYFNQSPDFENPHDSDGDNVYVIELIATDEAENSTSLLVNLTVKNLNENDPIITSDGGGESASVSVEENSTLITTVVTGGIEEGFDIYYTKSGPDSYYILLNSTTGELTFRLNPDFEFPVDSNKDNVYEVTITAQEGDRTDSQTILINVTDAFESKAPVFISEPILSVNSDQFYEYSIITDDPDNDKAELSLESGPDWLELKNDKLQVTTFAGSGNGGYIEGQRLVAEFEMPNDIAMDASGNFYVLDEYSRIIRKISINGEVTTLAGSGAIGSTNGNGEIASFKSPIGLVIDDLGNLFVTDGNNGLIRKVTPSGEVSTFAGSGNNSYADGNGTSASFDFPSGIAIDATGNLFVTDFYNDRIRKITPSGEVSTFAGSGQNGLLNGIGTEASFNGPIDLAIDSHGNIFVLDQYNYRIRKITSEGVVSSFAGSGESKIEDGTGDQASFKNLNGITIDANDIIYISDAHSIRQISPEGVVSTIAGSEYGTFLDGIGTNTNFSSPGGLTVAPDGAIYVADRNTHRIRKIAQTSSLSGTPLGITGDFEVELKASDPDDGSNTQSFTITVIDIIPPVFTSSTSSTFVENGTGIAYTITATDANDVTYSLGVGNDEDLFDLVGDAVTFKTIPDFEAPTDGNTDNDYVIRVKASDGVNEVSQLVTITVTNVDEAPVIISTPVTSVKESSQYVYGVSIENLSDISYTLEAEVLPDWMTLIGKNAVTKYAGSSEVGQDDGTLLNATFNIPLGITRDEDDNLYVTDLFNHVIRKVSNSGQVSTIAGTGAIGYVNGNASIATFNEPSSIVRDSEGNLYVADRENHAVRKISPSGEVSTFAGNGQRGYVDGQGTSAQFSRPTELAIDSNDNIYVTDQSNYRVRKISPEGVVSTIAGNGEAGYVDGDGAIAQFSQLTGIIVDLNGDIYVSDYDNHRIRKISPQGMVSTLAGSSTRSVIDGLGAEAAFYSPAGMAVDENFNIYITDQRYVRRITPDGQVTTIAGSDQNGNTDGEGLSASFNEPHSVVIDSKGDLFITESSNNLIRRVSLKDYTLVGNPLNRVGIHSVSLKSINSNGETNVQSFSVEVLDATPPLFTSASTATFTENGTGTAYTIAATDASSITYLLGTGNDEGLFDVNETTGEVTFKVSPDFENPQDTDTNNSYVVEVLATDALNNSASLLVTISVTNADNEAPIFTSTPITEVNDNEQYEYFVKAIDPDGDIIDISSDQLPTWLSLSNEYMVSTYAGSGSNGTTDGVSNQAEFSFTAGLEVDSQGNVYIADWFNRTIRKIDLEGNVTTIAGNPDADPVDNLIDGNGTSASFGAPFDIAIDNSNNVYVPDVSNNAIRKIDKDGNVTTIAGSTTAGANDGEAVNATFNMPSKIDIDNEGNIYILDVGNNRIRVISQEGMVSTLAGSSEGYADGTGGDALFSNLTDITVAADGNIYVTEGGISNKVRKITKSGVVTTLSIPGSAFFGLAAITSDKRSNLYVADAQQQIRKIDINGNVSVIAGSNGSESGNVNGKGSDARFHNPYGLAFDREGNLFVCDVQNFQIKKVERGAILNGDPAGQTGSNQVSLTATDGIGTSINQSFSITVVDASPPVFTSASTATFTENGTGTAYTIAATDASSIAYSLGTSNDEGLFDVNETSGEITFKVSPDFESPQDSDTNNSYVVEVFATDALDNSASQTVTISVTNADNEAPVFTSTPITSINEGDTYSYSVLVSDVDGDNTTISIPTKPSWLNITNITGGDLTAFAGRITSGRTNANGTSASFNWPTGLAIDKTGNIYVADAYNDLIRKITPSGDVSTIAGAPVAGLTDANGKSAKFRKPTGVAIDRSGNLYVADLDNYRIRKITPNGDVTTFAGSNSRGSTDGRGEEASFDRPVAIAVDGLDNLYVADYGSHKIRKITPNGEVSTLAGSGYSGSIDAIGLDARFNRPHGIAVDGSGNVYVADLDNHKIRKITPSGNVTTFAGSGIQGGNDGNGTSASFSSPSGIFVGGAGNIYVVDYGNSKIRKITPAGDVTTLLGSENSVNNDFGGSGYGETPTSNPNGIVSDALGNIYVTDVRNHTIRKVSAPQIVLSGNSTGNRGAHNVVLEVNDGNEGTAQQSFTIIVNDVTVPVFTSATAINYAENGTGTAYTISATDANAITYSLGTGNDEAFFNISEGVVTFKTSPDFETKSSYTIQVKANDGSNESAQTVTITIIDVDEIPPVFTSATAVNYAENETGTAYTIVATDANDITYSLGTGNDEDFFNISEGVVTFKTSPDFETKSSYTIQVKANDGLNEAAQTVTITITDVDEIKPVVTLTADVNGLAFTPSVKISLKFSEIVTGLEVSDFILSNASVTNLEGSGDTYSLTLNSILDGNASVGLKENSVTDGNNNGNLASAIFIQSFEARNELPTEINLSSSVIAENVIGRTEIGTLTTKDSDVGDLHSYKLVSGAGSTDNDKFDIVGNKLFKKAGLSFDYEALTSLSVRVQVVDLRGGTYEVAKTISVSNIAEPAVALTIVDASNIELGGNSIIFDLVKIGASKTRQVKVKNTSPDASLQVSDVKLPAGFSASESNFTLAIGEEKIVNITFTPIDDQFLLKRLELVSNADVQQLFVVGKGVQNKAPIAIAPSVRIAHVPGNLFKLIGFDPEGEPIDFVITEGPSLGTLTARTQAGEYTFVPNSLSPETIYEDQVTFKVVEQGGGLSSQEATVRFRFGIPDSKHILYPITLEPKDENNIELVVKLEDQAINNEYFISGFYRGKEEKLNKVFRENISIPKSAFTIDGTTLTYKVSLSKNDYPALFTNTKVLMGVSIATANGFHDSKAQIFTRNSSGNLGGSGINDDSSKDGNFAVFAVDASVPENESINLKLSAIEFGDFDLSEAEVTIVKGPLSGTVGTPKLVSNKDGFAEWTLEYTSTSEIGLKDSIQFSVTHKGRNETLLAYARVNVIEVPDAPQLVDIKDQSMNEDQTITVGFTVTDPDSELSYQVISSDSNVRGTVVDGKIQLKASNDFNGKVNIQLLVTEVGSSNPQVVTDDFSLVIAPVNDAPIMTDIQNQTVNEDSQLTIPLSATDVDGNVSVFNYLATSNADDNVTYKIENGSLVVTPKADFFGEVEFTVRADDGTGTTTALSLGKTFKVTVAAVNDSPILSKAIGTQTLVQGFPTYTLDLANFFEDKETAAKDLTYTVSNITNVALSVNGSILTVTSANGSVGLQTAQLTVSDGELSILQGLNFLTAINSQDVTITNPITDITLDEDFGTREIDLSNVFSYATNPTATFAYSLAGNQNLNASVNGNKIELSSVQDFNGVDKLYVTATVDGKSTLMSFNIKVDAINDAPTLVSRTGDQSILEDVAFSKTVSPSSFTDVDNDALIYSATYSASWLSFDAITRTFSGIPNNDNVGEVTVTLTATDPSGAKANDVFKIIVNNVNDAPTAINLVNNTLDENTAIGADVTALSSIDIDAGDNVFTYQLVNGVGSTDNDKFTLNNGKLVLATSVDYETKSSYSIRLRTTDGYEGSFEQALTINVNDVNEAATAIVLDNAQIMENNQVGGIIGGISATDQDAGDTHSYTLVSGTGGADNASFEIVGNKLAAKTSFDFEAKASYSVRIKATDAGGLSFEDNFIIAITNQAEAILRIEGGQSAETTNVGETSALEISIFNDGDGVMEVTSITYPDGFTGPTTIDAIAPSTSKSIAVSFAPTEAKTYSGDIVINYNGGSGIKSVVAVAEIVASIDNGFIDETAVSIYPNPANDRITIDLAQYNGRPVEVSIFNESGLGLYNRSNIRHLTHNVEVSDYVQGIYIVLIKSEVGVVRKKLMIFR